MNTQIVIKEYGWIISEEKELLCPESKKASEDHACLPQKQLDTLIQFIRKTPRIQELMQVRYDKRVGNYIYIQNYVGELIFKNHLKIQILPKIYFGQTEDCTREVLLKMLIGSRNLSEKYFRSTEHAAADIDLLESYIHMYLTEASLLVRRGLRSSYEQKTDNLTCFKGRLQIPGHIRKNLTDRTHFYVSYEEFTLNRPENRLIKAALQQLSKISTRQKNRNEARRLLYFFDEVDVSVNYSQDFSRIHTDRNSREYSRILPWTKAILNNQGLLQFSQGFEATSLLFAMEEVFENYVARQVEKYFEENWDVSAQDNGVTLFDPPKEHQGSDKLYFRLRPDIVLRHKTKNRTVIFDTKWKPVPKNRYQYQANAREDMYQMYVYAGRFHASDIILLYPKSEYSDLYVNDYDLFHTTVGDQETTFHLFFIDLTDMEKSMQLLLKELESSPFLSKEDSSEHIHK